MQYMKRIHYHSKAAWAAARAAAARREADALPLVPSADWRGIKRRMSHQAALMDEARKFERIADRMRASGQ